MPIVLTCPPEKWHGCVNYSAISQSKDSDISQSNYSDISHLVSEVEADAAIAPLELSNRRRVGNHYARIGQGRPESIESSSLHLDILRDLKRISSHLTSVAYPILDRAGKLAASRLVEIDKS